jgi:anaerobic magnesium-protoporphyrin IX monomethyl ester cyclase
VSATRLGRATLLVNPPLINGIAFTRQGRCQEREEVLGTTKPPYSLLVIAALLREQGTPARLVDLTAEGRSTASLVDELKRDGFAPALVVFPSTTPTLHADTAEMRALKVAFGARLVCFGPHASTVPVESMQQAPDVDVMVVGEPEDAVMALASRESLTDLDGVAGVTWRRPDGSIVPPTGHGAFTNFKTMPFPAWDLLPLANYRLPMVSESYIIVETSRGCPYSCDFCVAPIHQGHKFRERDPKVLVNEIERAKRELGVRYFYLWGDTVTLNQKTFGAFCEELIARDLGIHWFGNARADNLTDPAFVHRLRRSGCWMLAMGIESSSPEIRKDMVKRLEEQKIRAAFENLREAGIKSFAFFIFGYPGDTPESMAATIDYAIDLEPDFANFYPAVPYPGTALYDKVRKEGLLASEDWSKMEYSYYLLEGHGLNEQVVMAAINRAKRRFFLRPRYLTRHLADAARLAWTKPAIVTHMLSRVLLGQKVMDATPAAMPLPTPATFNRESGRA